MDDYLNPLVGGPLDNAPSMKPDEPKADKRRADDDSDSDNNKKSLLANNDGEKHVDSKLNEMRPKEYKNSAVPSLLVQGEDFTDPEHSDSSHSSWVRDSMVHNPQPSLLAANTIDIDHFNLMPPPNPVQNNNQGGIQGGLLAPPPKRGGIAPNRSLDILPIPSLTKPKPEPLGGRAHHHTEDKRLEVYNGLDSLIENPDETAWDDLPAAEGITFGDEVFDSQTLSNPRSQTGFDYMASNIDDMMQSNQVAFLSGSQMLNKVPSLSKMPNLQFDLHSLDKLSMLGDIDIFVLPSRTCEICKQTIEDDYTFINGGYYHPQCVKCYGCQSYLDDNNAYIYQEHLMCKDCILKDHNTKCKACGQQILGALELIRTNAGDNYHVNCLTCFSCAEPLAGKQYKEAEGKLFCTKCIDKIRKRKCADCGNYILDSNYVFHNKQFFHREHFKCAMCSCVLKGDMFVTHHNKFYCIDHGSCFLDSCSFCHQRFNVVCDKIKWRGKYYHKDCFVCRVCGEKLEVASTKSYHNRPHCTKCYDMRVKLQPDSNRDHQHMPANSIEIRNSAKKMKNVIEYRRSPRGENALEGPPQIVTNTIRTPLVEDLTLYP